VAWSRLSVVGAVDGVIMVEASGDVACQVLNEVA
jgi:hypothetical protein